MGRPASETLKKSEANKTCLEQLYFSTAAGNSQS
jgi:hypothetical protein